MKIFITGYFFRWTKRHGVSIGWLTADIAFLDVNRYHKKD
jgi:hypothetical protein